MNSFRKVVLHGSAIALVAVSLAGCGNSDRRRADAPEAPPSGGGAVTVRQEDQFGMGFAAAFRADNNSEPQVVNDGDIVAISLTTEPVSIN